MEDQLKSNRIRLVGTVHSELEYSHALYGENFYLFNLAVQRLSDKTDNIQVTASERIMEDIKLCPGTRIEVEGQLRSYNKQEESHNRLILTVFAQNIKPSSENCDDPNQIVLEGYICKKPVFRTTPFGREITDLLVAVNRLYNKSDYIPVIAWGRNARFAGNLAISEKIRIEGRFQSREYQKNFSETESETRIAYEVSVSRLLKLSEEEGQESSPLEVPRKEKILTY